ncbi:MAG: hypothetical protein RIF46_04195, partial [Cyclobacteriaceae bacterium]
NGGIIQGQAQLGYFVSENFSLGLILAGTGATGDFDSQGDGGLIGPELRYYVNGQFILESAYLTTIESGNSTGQFQGGVGYALFVMEKVALEPLLIYSQKKEEFFGGTFTTRNFNFNITLSLFL